MSRDAMAAWPAHVVMLPSLVVLGALVSAGSILLLRPWLARYAMARPSARGLHRVPTPQGGGIAVMLACVVVVVAGASTMPSSPDLSWRIATVLAAAVALAAIGFVDDVRPLPPLPRLLLQLTAVAFGVAALPEGCRVAPFLPHAVEVALLVLAGTWFVNLTNFMDGMDGITVADALPVAAALVLFWAAGLLAAVPGLASLGLCGGLLGYAPFNKPVARLFLGDVGSLPIGFLLAYGLFSLAGHGGGSVGGLAAAVLLPLYPLADSGVTLIWRLRRGERVWEPHRSHFYQVAILRGFTVWQVLVRVLAVNALLVVLALVCREAGTAVTVLGVTAGAAGVGVVLRAFGTP